LKQVPFKSFGAVSYSPSIVLFYYLFYSAASWRNKVYIVTMPVGFAVL